jgi:tetratricopeptide (TPR) repeat protein
MSDFTYRRLALIMIIFSGLLVYGNTLNYPQFLFDGNLFLLNNPLFKSMEYYARLFDVYEFSRLDEQLGLNPDVTTNFMMRPVAYLTFTANYYLSGFNPAAFRAVNIVIHVINALLVFACIELLIDISSIRVEMKACSTRFIPTVSAFVFLLHPMQTESVTYITQRFASLAALFYLVTIWTYLLWSLKMKRGIVCNRFRWISFAALLLGMFTRESLFTAPFILLLLELTVLGNGLKVGLRRAVPHLMLLPVIPFHVIVVSAAQNSSSPTFWGAINVVNYVDTPISHYALTQLVVVVSYLRLYLLPYGQNIDPDQQLYTLPYQLPVVGSALVIMVLVFGSYGFYRNNKSDVRPTLIFVGICWYFLALAVTSSVIPLPDLMAEHRAYFPSVGFILAFVTSLDLVRTSPGKVFYNRTVVAGVVVWCLILIVLTTNRNTFWKSGIRLWSDAVAKSPEKERPWSNLGIAYHKSANYSEAARCFATAVTINSNSGLLYEMLADSYIELKRFQDAVDAGLRGISVDPANPALYNNLGIAYAELDRFEDARQAFETAVALLPGYRNAVINLDKIESFMESRVGRRQ